MNRGFPWGPFGWDPSYWNPNQNQNQQPWAWHVRDPYWNRRTVFSNVGWNARVPLPGGLMGHPSYSSPRPIGRPPRLPTPQRGIISPGVQSSNSSGQRRGRDLDRNAGKQLLSPGDPSNQRRETPFLPPKKRAEFKSAELHRGQHGSGSDDNSSKSAAEKPLDPVQETPDPQPASSTKTGLGSLVPPALSAPAPLESPDVDVYMTERNDQGDVLGLDGYMEKKRLLSKTLLADAEGEFKVTTKKTRLGWGQGLAKYEKQKQQDGQKLVACGDNETRNEAVIYTATAPASSYRPTQTPGSNVDLGNNITNTTEMMVPQVPVPAYSLGCCPVTGDIGYQGNSSTSLAETVIRHAEVTDFSHKHSLQPDNHRCLVSDVGGSCNPCNNSSSMTETAICTATVPTSSSHESSPPPANIDDHGNINMSMAETVIFPKVSASSCSSLSAIGGNNDHCNRISSMTEMVVSELASSHICDLPAAAGFGKKRMSLTENVISPTVPAFSDSSTCPPDGGGNSDTSKSSMSTTKGMACPGSSHGCSLPSGANGVHGNRSMMSLLAEKVVRPPDVPPPSRICSTPSAAGDNGALGNSCTSLIAVTMVNADTMLSSSDGFNLPLDGSNGKSIKVQDVPHELISQPINKIQNSARMPAIIIRKLQKPREFLNKNIVFKEPQTNDLQGSGIKTWSQEEKDVFAEKITGIGTDLTKISSFLSHKTTTDCIEYYSKHYKSERSKKSNKCLPTTKQLQEKCKNVNDAAPYMSGIATVTATKSYKRMKTVEEDLKNPAKQICHESMTHLQSHSHADDGHHVESSIEEYERVTGNVLLGEMNVTSLQGINSPITNSGEAACLTIPKTEVAELKNLSEDSCSNEETRKGEQEIWTKKERCHLIEAIEIHGMDFSSISVYVGTKSIQQCKNFLSNCKNDINLVKKHLNNSNSSITVGTNVGSATRIIQSYSKVKENVPQPITSADHGDGENYQPGGSSGQGSSEIIIMSFSESCQKLPNVTTEDCQIISGEENPEICSISKECNVDAEHSWNDDTETNSVTNVDNNAPSDMVNPRSDNNPYIATNGPELSGHHELVQPLDDSEGLKIGSKENNDKAIGDEKMPEHSIASREGSGIHLGCSVNSQRDKEIVDIISSVEGRDLNVPPMLASDGASKISSLSATSSSAALKIVYAKTSHGEVDMDLNIPHDVAPPYLNIPHNNCPEASMDLQEPLQTTDVAEIIEHASSIRARATNDMGGDSERANDVAHVQETHQSQTTIAETGHHPANQPGCIMLFGQVIYQAPSSSGTNLNSSQGNQFVARSADMPCATDVPVRAQGGQLYPSGHSIWRSAPVNHGQQVVLSNNTINLGQQTILSNNTMNLDQHVVLSSNTMNLGQQAVLSNTTMPCGSTSGAAAWRPPLQFGSSGLDNMSQQRQYVHMMMRYSIMRGGVPYHLWQGSSSNGLINFNFNPGQQQWPNDIQDTSRVVMGYPCLPGSTQNQAPIAIMPSGINIEGVSTSNTGFSAARRGRGRGRGPRRGRPTS